MRGCVFAPVKRNALRGVCRCPVEREGASLGCGWAEEVEEKREEVEEHFFSGAGWGGSRGTGIGRVGWEGFGGGYIDCVVVVGRLDGVSQTQIQSGCCRGPVVGATIVLSRVCSWYRWVELFQFVLTYLASALISPV